MSTIEIISSIKHSNELIILVEGKEDIRIYRWLLESIGKQDCLMPTNGCVALKDIFERKNEFASKKVVFVTDRDSYVYGSIPSKYEGMVFTKGYSIENDLYCGKKLYNEFFDKEDKNKFDLALEEFLLYYASELDKFKAGDEPNFKESPEKILDGKEFKLKKNFVSRNSNTN